LPLPRRIPVRPILYGLGGIVFVVMVAFAWGWYQDAQRAVNQTDTAVSRVARLGTPTPTGARLPTAIPIVIATDSPTLVPTPEPTPVPTATPVINGILVEFRTNARVYVEASVDGKPVLADTFDAGTQKQLPLAQTSVIMRTSNGSAVNVTVNGTPQNPQTATDPVELTWQR
jgi:hypothetical protein